MLRTLFALMICIAAAQAAVVKAVPLSELKCDPPLPAAAIINHVGLSVGDGFVDQDSDHPVLAVRLPKEQDVTGVFGYYATEEEEQLQRVTFSISAATIAAAPDGMEIYGELSREYAKSFLSKNDDGFGEIIPTTKDRGTKAWWHFRSRGFIPATDAQELDENARNNRSNDDLLDFFSGTTALNENLQFDQIIRVTEGEPTVLVKDLPRLTTRPVAWDKIMSADTADVSIDFLASHIPADQHAVFVRSFAALHLIMEKGDALLAGPLQIAIGRAEDGGILKRYQRQLGLELTELSRRFGDQVVESVAMTGSDPFLRMGSDVAVLLRAKPAHLQLLTAYLTVRRKTLIDAGAEAVSGIAGTLAWQGAVSVDRSISSYVLVDGDVVLVTNSKVQLEAYAAVRAKKHPALADEPEMRFFRQRYNKNDSGELALAVISDATIRRWCDADFRIGDALRQRAAIRLANLQTEWIYAGCPAQWQPAGDNTDLGNIAIDTRGVRSSIYGSLHFMTPVAELGVTKVTEAEAESYRRFLRRYEDLWRASLDPIALQISLGADKSLALDLSILPLAMGSDYLELVNVVGNKRVSTADGDPHDALFHTVYALDPESDSVKQLNSMFSRQLGGLEKPMSWIGDHIAFYIDDDPVWDEMLKEASELSESELFEKFLPRLPLAMHVSVKNPLGLAAFMAGLKTFIDQVAPNMLQWETIKHGELSYVRISPTPEGRRQFASFGLDQLHLLYLTAPEGLTVTFSETVMKNVIERIVARRSKEEPSERPAATQQALFTMMPRLLSILDLLHIMDISSNPPSFQSGDTAAILDEWRQLYPDQDPVVLHERWWGVKPLCPLGGTYRWNPHWLTMESTASPWGDGNKTLPEPTPPSYATMLQDVSSARIGINFEILPDPPRDPDLQPGERRVTVLAGDTWRSIANQQGVRREQLLERNKAKKDDPLEPGSVLIVPVGWRDPGKDVGLRVRLEIKPVTEQPQQQTAPAAEETIP